MDFSAPPARIGGGTIEGMRPARIPDGQLEFFREAPAQPSVAYSKTASNRYVHVPVHAPVMASPYNADLALGSYMFVEQTVGRPTAFERADMTRGVSGSVTAVAKTLSSVNYELAHTPEQFGTPEDVLNRYKPLGPNTTQGITETQKRRDQKIVLAAQGAARIIDYWGAPYAPGLVAGLLLLEIPAGQQMTQKKPTGDNETFTLQHDAWQFVPIVATEAQLAANAGQHVVIRVGRITCTKRSGNIVAANSDPYAVGRNIAGIVAGLLAPRPGAMQIVAASLPLWHPNVAEDLIDVAL